MQTLDNGIPVPTNSDEYDLVDDLTVAFGAANVIYNVTSQAQRDALPPVLGRTVRRLDLAKKTLQSWDGSKWVSNALGEIASSANAGPNVVGTALNNMLELTPTVEEARRIEVRAYVDGASSVDALYCSFTLAFGGTGVGGTPLRTTTKRYATANLGEGIEVTARHTTTAAGALRFNLQGQVTITAGTVTAAANSTRLTITDLGPA